MSQSFDDFIASLDIPEACYLDQKLYKKQFYELAKMNRARQEFFAKTVASVTWTHTLKKATINIPPLVTDKLEYIEIAFIHVRLQEKAHMKKIAEVIHLIPYPVVLWITYESNLCVCTAQKYINQADSSKLTTDEYLYSEWIDLRSPTAEASQFLQSLELKHLSFESFYHFYQDVCDLIVAFKASALGATFSTADTSQKKQILDKIQVLEEQILSVRSAIKKESQFNAKVRFNMQVKELLAQVETLKNSL